MNLRRTLLLITITLAVTLGTTTPAHATYTAKSNAFAPGVTALTVAAPAKVSTAGTKCVTTYGYGRPRTTLRAKISWPASTTTRGVVGYVVTAHFADGSSTPVAWVDAPETSVSGNYDASYATQNIRVTVTTYTSYGWTAESATSGTIKC